MVRLRNKKLQIYIMEILHPKGRIANNHDVGWSFTGWAPLVESMVRGDATYVAQWSQNEYTVTYQPGAHGTFDEVSTSGLHYGDTTPEGPMRQETTRMAGALQAGIQK